MEVVGGRLFLLGVFLVLYVYGVHGNSGVHVKSFRTHKIDRNTQRLSPTFGINILNRTSFPEGFVFGTATSSYQVEGGWNSDGKGLSNWDYFSHKYPDKLENNSNGDVAADSYHKYKEDVKLLKEMNTDSYRFSISWSRLIPTGKINKGINERGIQYYNNLIDELVANGLTAAVTLFHWELPQALENEYGGFLSPKIIKDYLDFVNLCFERFGDRVKLWITFNEPYSYSNFGYDNGLSVPGRCSSWLNGNCSAGDSGTEPYTVSHHQLLAHAYAVQLYRTKYQAQQKGIIGMTNVCNWMVPMTNSSLDMRAAKRSLDFMYGWFMNPLVYGDYPKTMKAVVGNRLPKFTHEESKLLKGSYDFHGVNYYTAMYASHSSNPPNKTHARYITDYLADLIATRQGVLIGEEAGSNWLHSYPKGLWHLLLYVQRKYNNPVIYITENGVDEINDASLPLEQALQDDFRIRYYYRHLQFLRKAIKNGVRVRGFYGWSLIDNFEWLNGYSVRFGFNFVDYNTLKRHRKLSSYCFSTCIFQLRLNIEGGWNADGKGLVEMSAEQRSLLSMEICSLFFRTLGVVMCSTMTNSFFQYLAKPKRTDHGKECFWNLQ
ncbi:OLC1v1022836C1 [Oldenlandia corymbosa var. corymbosa]|uniref:OLC1v1022836C1 n=1 Tax=Oldenlandia corymbosa var. corymbosa TaxID=529605 RepID=A0AAV1C133_OLDCO|nr:OLC1v1022836C1 [Oldenlandia corymbosa var. corymbosa]